MDDDARAVLRLAMWSGPRNISTAMMRSWEGRGDTAVVDEPLYAHYLLHTRLPHPGADDVIAHHETDWRKVVDALLGPVPNESRILYQKHMAHHLLPHIERGWLDDMTHCFLIREPREMLTSLLQTLPDARLEDTGLPQQVELFEHFRSVRSALPPVLDARDVLENPAALLRALCEALGVPFTERMLAWPSGPRATDGIWAKHWYDNVWKSTGFAPYRAKSGDVPPEAQNLLRACNEHYDHLYAHRMTAATGAAR